LKKLRAVKIHYYYVAEGRGIISLTETLIIDEFHEFGGKHCETASLKKVLNFHELSISEEMLLGLARA